MSGDITEFHLGVSSAFDHDSANETSDVAGETVTTLVSWWNHLLCDTCGHTFRRGDRVHRDSHTRAVSHLDGRLRCTGSDKPGPRATELTEFSAGVDEAWPPAVDVPVAKLTADDWRVQKPPDRLDRSRCRFCAHTFREGEFVVVCPCRPEDPACGLAVHRDPAAGMVCWESWRSGGANTTCPFRSSHRPQDARR